MSRSWFGLVDLRQTQNWNAGKLGYPNHDVLCDPGCYSLVIHLRRSKSIRVGKLGAALFQKGTYVYTGSAMNGLGARLNRHMRRQKKLHWHIDYLLASAHARIEKVILYPPATDQECRQNQRIGALPGASIAIKRFGATDCRRGCMSHLVFFAENSRLNFAGGFNR